jgi:hypothetical protein
MKRPEDGSGFEARRGFLRNLLLTLAGAVGVVALGRTRPRRPEEKDLREADFYRKHHLAG